MGIMLQDLSRKIQEEDVAYFGELESLMNFHKRKAEEYQHSINSLTTTRSMLDYLKRQHSKAGNEVHAEILLVMETGVQREVAYQQLTYHQQCVSVFEAELNDFMVTKYHVHRSIVEEWVVDVAERLLYRKPKVVEDTATVVEEVQAASIG